MLAGSNVVSVGLITPVRKNQFFLVA